MDTYYEQEKAKIKEEAFAEGVCYALEYLASLYEGVTDTDLWSEFYAKVEAKK